MDAEEAVKIHWTGVKDIITPLIIFNMLCPRLHLPAGDGGGGNCGVPDFSLLCALWHFGPSALGPGVGSPQQPRYRQRLDVRHPRQEPLDWGERSQSYKSHEAEGGELWMRLTGILPLTTDKHAEEDASDGHHHAGRQSYGHSWVYQGLQGGEQLWRKLIHYLQAGRPTEGQGVRLHQPLWYHHRMHIFLDRLIPCVCVLQVFVGNTDNDSTKTNLFDPPIVAQYIRIIPVVCRRACTLRMELVGCELNGKCTESVQDDFNVHSKFRKDRKWMISSLFELDVWPTRADALVSVTFSLPLVISTHNIAFTSS